MITQTCEPHLIECGADSSYAVTQDGSLYAWGQNDCGQLGFFSDESCVYAPTKVLFSSKVAQISAGRQHAALVCDQGNVYTCGSNAYGQLGHTYLEIAEVGLKSRLISCGHDYTMVLTLDGELMIAGKMPFEVSDRDSIPQFE